MGPLTSISDASAGICRFLQEHSQGRVSPPGGPGSFAESDQRAEIVFFTPPRLSEAGAARDATRTARRLRRRLAPAAAAPFGRL
eukprot:282923-Alexandrium_andersonii.AAC.1